MGSWRPPHKGFIGVIPRKVSKESKMRKILMLVLAAATVVPAIAPTAASAQSAHELRRDQRDIDREHREIHRDMARGDYREARRDMRDLRNARQEYREDWRDYRRAHGDVFRGPAYAGPRGYAYRPVTPGYQFAPDYYHRRYWINDPMAYRLPRPGMNQRWVRYGRDVVRVDLRTGRAVQVYGSFFY
jgi:Ni/Co efflux regulator RcnB